MRGFQDNPADRFDGQPLVICGAGASLCFWSLSGSRWGVKGQEDLGGGMKAIFQLENGFDPGTGRLNQGGREFGRQAYVGLSGNQWGTVTLGRQYDPSVYMVQGITADNYWGAIVATPGDVDNYDNSLRVSNAVKYVSPNFAGFQVEGLYGFSNLAGATG
ncbi:porin [Caballeronia calidae]|uniref:Porin n=1 Tax=Caballeronia calidae TaxID=1777139 RepID=A0A158EGL4_9BURK|nr:porin [Caballeronia calidae]